MSDSIDLPINHDDRLYDPPLIDHLNREAEGFSVEFVPTDTLSTDETCFVSIILDSPDGRMMLACLNRAEEICHMGSIQRIIHSGGGNYRIIAANGQAINLEDCANADAVELSDRIHQMAEMAQTAFRVLARAKSA